MTDGCLALTELEPDYSEKDQRSMLVWSPSSQVSDAMCKYSIQRLINCYGTGKELPCIVK